ncbi:MAG: pyridoxal-phosphate dependent enzyme [Candidatus Bathyarchaeota archaeon]|nr:pyridoxal-phosphate dependent enzyme [Candidatus Bathyarchaeota archaeon]
MPIINETYPGLEGIPWLKIGDFPSDIEKLGNMGQAHGFSELYIKRDDRCSKVYGGNKVRKLEYMLADAKEKGKKTLVTLGGTGSNQVLATGIFGADHGFRTTGIMLHQLNAEYVRKNLLMDHYYGIELIFAKNTFAEVYTFISKYLRAQLGGGKPYFVTAGASNEIGNMGFVNAAFELKQQVDKGEITEPDYIIVACGSIGTTAGLNLGCKLAGLKTKVLGVRVAMPWLVTKWRMGRMIRDINVYMKRHDASVPLMKVKPEDLYLLDGYLGEEYACFTEKGCDAVDEMKNLEGIPLDQTYTGKALGGGLDWLKKQSEQDKVVLFWNTYNSVDLSEKAANVDYRELPKQFHRYFTEPTQEETFRKEG